MQILYFCTSIKAIRYSRFNKFCYRINNLSLILFLPPSISGATVIIPFKYISQLQRKNKH